MLRIDTFISWLLSVVVIFVIFYAMMLFLPVFLLVIGGYILYQFIRFKWIQYQLKKRVFHVDISEEKYSDSNIIDAEFEILDEKVSK